MIRPYFSRAQLNADRLAALLVTLAPLVYFFPALRGQIVISPDDGVIFNVPLRVAAANLIRAGHLPLWNPYLFSGMPLHGAAQAGVLFPLNWFYLIASPPVATNLMMLATYMVAALGAFLYARRAGADLNGAIVTSFIWQFSAFFVEQVGHTNIIQTAAMLPWLLWALEGYLKNGARWRGVLLAALVAVQVFAGHQQTCAYALLLAGAYAVVLVRAAKGSRSSYLRPLALLAFGLALAAVQILPTIELLRNSLRASASYDFFSSFSMPPRFALTLFAPYLFGGGNGLLFRAPYVGPTFFGEYVAYVGLLTIMLALVAVLLKPDVRTKFWAIVFVVCLLLAFGRFLPFYMYAIVYYLPVLGLFRVPARHLMEVEFALAVLAGRGITAIAAGLRQANDQRRRTITAATIAGFAVLLITWLAVMWGRPAEFRLGRQAPLTLMRAPELFVPVAMAALSFAVLWWVTRSNRRSARVCLLAVLLLDLAVYGQSSGWRTNSPARDSELWREPAAVKFLRDREGIREGSYRILTADQAFDPALPVPPATPGAWVLPLQPDIYMMHGIENAAGYDGFGLARYSRLAGDMKIWGELAEPERTLRGDGRELDLLNVHYLLTRSMGATPGDPPATADSPTSEFPAATLVYDGQRFGEDELKLSPITAGQRVAFKVPPVAADQFALLTNLAWSETVADGTFVAQIDLHAESGETLNFELRAGVHTSEWAHDRPDIRARIKHKRAPVATSYLVEDSQGKYEAHTYVASFSLPRKTVITGGAVTVAHLPAAPQLSLSVSRVTLADGERAFPLRREWVRKESAASLDQPLSSGSAEVAAKGLRWRHLAEVEKVAVFENTRVLPRAWLASGELVATENEEIAIIRTGKTAAGAQWNPLEQALVESSSGIAFGKEGEPPAQDRRAEVTRHEPNRVEVKTQSAAPSILVLSENHSPGWQASVDGNPVEVMRVNYNQRGVALTSGNHLVTFVYRPKSVMLGLVISLLALASLLLWASGVGARFLSGRDVSTTSR